MAITQTSQRITGAVALALAMVPASPVSNALAQPPPPASSQPSAALPSATLLNAERTNAQAFSAQMRDLGKLVDSIDVMAKPTKADVDALTRQAEAVKRSIPIFRQNVSSAISKIKGIGGWNPDLDALVERRLQRQSPERLAAFRAGGGARALLEKVAGHPDLNALPAELDLYIREISGRGVIGRLIEELTGVPMFARGKVGNAIRAVAGAVADAVDGIEYAADCLAASVRLGVGFWHCG
jgi:hypothetical protein